MVPSHGQHVGAGVHHDEEEDSGQVEPLEVRVILHHQVQQVGYFLHQDGVKGQEQLWMTGEWNGGQADESRLYKDWVSDLYLDDVRQTGAVTYEPLHLW